MEDKTIKDSTHILPLQQIKYRALCIKANNKLCHITAKIVHNGRTVVFLNLALALVAKMDFVGVNYTYLM